MSQTAPADRVQAILNDEQLRAVAYDPKTWQQAMNAASRRVRIQTTLKYLGLGGCACVGAYLTFRFIRR